MPNLPTITPQLFVSPAVDAIEFYKKAFGFKEIHRMTSPEGKIMHCSLLLGKYRLLLADGFDNRYDTPPQKIGGSPVVIQLGVADIDAAFDRAVQAGATVTMPPTDMFWGDRYGALTDPFGHRWSMAQQKENLSPEELKKRTENAIAKFFK